MKKLLTIVLSLVMVFSMTAVSFADTTYTDQGTVTITKDYTLVGAGVSPAETFTFNVIDKSVENAGTNVTEVPDLTITGATFAAGGATGSATATVTLPEYAGVGEYTYTLKEAVGNTAGVTYSASAIVLKVTVIQQGDELIRVPAVSSTGEVDKSLGFDNTYTANNLTVAKEVTGLLGDRDKSFDFTVTFTSPEDNSVVKEDIKVDDTVVVAAGKDGWTGTREYTFQLKHGESITFTNLPKGVSYVVAEATPADYNATYVNETGTMNDTAITATVTNLKDGDIDTGIIMDNGIYILLLVGAAAGAGLFIARRRNSFES